MINLLNLKEKNLIFNEKFCIDKKIKNITCNFFRAILTYSTHACYNCGHIFDSNIIKYGFKSSNILLPNISGFKTYLNLRKQRFYYKHCNPTFTLKSSIVKDNCFISNNTKLSIAYDAKKIISQKDIGNDNKVSTTTVVRVMQEYYNHYSQNKNYLPKHLCFDEFKSVKSAKRAMSFIFYDSKTGKIIDIYKPYTLLIKELFPNAKIILDKFHLVQLISRAFNKIRAKIINSKYKSLKTIYNKQNKCIRLKNAFIFQLFFLPNILKTKDT
jgi:transposase